MSFSSWAFEFTFINETKSNGLFDIFDILTANIMLPLGGLAMAIFAGWVMKRESTADEFGGDDTSYKIWRFVVRYITPLCVIAVFLKAFGVFDAGS
jgi:NSS family neurotransmitter:Na+ symporter